MNEFPSLIFLSSELIIRCIDRRLETLTIIDTESLELFLHDHVVSLWGQSGWMTAKYSWKKEDFISFEEFFCRKIIAEVIRVEYRPLQNTNSAANSSTIQVKIIWILLMSFSFCS